jgi:hypothetical protein
MDIEAMFMTIGAAHALEHIAAWKSRHAGRCGMCREPSP